MRRRTEAGSVAPLIIGFAVVVALLVVVVVDASAGYLRREGMNALADAASLAATDGIQGELAYTRGLDDGFTIDRAAADRYVAAFLNDSGARARYPGLTWVTSMVGRSVVVRVAAPLALPLHLPGRDRPVLVRGSAAAVLQIAP